MLNGFGGLSKRNVLAIIIGQRLDEISLMSNKLKGTIFNNPHERVLLQMTAISNVVRRKFANVFLGWEFKVYV